MGQLPALALHPLPLTEEEVQEATSSFAALLLDRDAQQNSFGSAPPVSPLAAPKPAPTLWARLKRGAVSIVDTFKTNPAREPYASAADAVSRERRFNFVFSVFVLYV